MPWFPDPNLDIVPVREYNTTMMLTHEFNRTIDMDGNNLVAAHSMILSLKHGQFMRVSTVWNTAEGKFESSYRFMWLRVHGLSFSWLEGDPVGATDPGTRGWWRTSPDHTLNPVDGFPVAHHEAVKSLVTLIEALPEFPAATYQRKLLPSLFTSSANTVLAKDDPVLATNRTTRASYFPENLPMLEITKEDLNAIMNNSALKTHTYALEA